MKKIALFAAAAMTLAIAGAAAADPVVINTGVDRAVQTSNSTVNQAAAATATAVGNIQFDSELKALGVNGNNTVSIDKTLETEGYANATQSLGVNLAANFLDQGSYATANGAASATGAGLFTPASSASNYGATSGTWNQAGSLTGSLSYNAGTDLSSLSAATSFNEALQSSLAPVGQQASAGVMSGAVLNNSISSGLAVNQNNAFSSTVVVKSK